MGREREWQVLPVHRGTVIVLKYCQEQTAATVPRTSGVHLDTSHHRPTQWAPGGK